MDSAVGLIQTYLRVNGYFTVSEYPVVEFVGGYQAATDVDIMAVRFPRYDRTIAGEERGERHPPFEADPLLDITSDRMDMIVGEVKEGAAEFNASGRRPEVLATALARFGCCPPEAASSVIEDLLRKGRTVTDGGHGIRLIAFGGTLGGGSNPAYERITLGHALRYLEEWVDRHWPVLRHTQSKDPVLAVLLTLAKARRGDPSGEIDPA